MSGQETDADRAAHEMAIEQWRIKRLIKSLDRAKGNGTSMITLIIPPGDDINRHTQLLTNEASTASRIKVLICLILICLNIY